MPDIHDSFPSNFLKAADLKGAEPIVTIERVSFEPVGPTKDMKPVVYFAGKRKGLVLNKTNSQKIASILGSRMTEQWVGRRIQLYATKVEFQGESVDAVRVRAPNDPAVSRPAVPSPRPPVTPAPDEAMVEMDSEVGF